MARAKQSMDGNTAAAHVAYAYTEVAGGLFPYRCLPASRRKIFLGRYQR